MEFSSKKGNIFEKYRGCLANYTIWTKMRVQDTKAEQTFEGGTLKRREDIEGAYTKYLWRKDKKVLPGKRWGKKQDDWYIQETKIGNLIENMTRVLVPALTQS